MDPLSLEKLLSIINAVEISRNGEFVTESQFHEIVNEYSRAKDLNRRVQDLLRVLGAMKLLEATKQGKLRLTSLFSEFVSAWNENELLRLNNVLAHYPPYSRFLEALRQEKEIVVPNRENKISRRELGSRLKIAHDLTFVAFDTFRFWSVATGHAYLSPFDDTLYWGGNWNDETPQLDVFELVCRKSFSEVETTSGFANIGRLGDQVCRRLYISYQAFEIKMNLLLKTKPGAAKVATTTIREPSRKYRIVDLRPRIEVLRENKIAELSGQNANQTSKLRWSELRYVEDGIRVNNRLVKLVRWEIFNDPPK